MDNKQITRKNTSLYQNVLWTGTITEHSNKGLLSNTDLDLVEMFFGSCGCLLWQQGFTQTESELLSDLREDSLPFIHGSIFMLGGEVQLAWLVMHSSEYISLAKTACNTRQYVQLCYLTHPAVSTLLLENWPLVLTGAVRTTLLSLVSHTQFAHTL